MSDLLHELICTISENEVSHNMTEKNRRVTAEWTIETSNICGYNDLKMMLERFPPRDKVEITISNLVEERIVINNKNIVEKKEEYIDFENKIGLSDELNIQIIITKEIIDGVLSVYNIEGFNNYLLSLNIIDVVRFFEEDLKKESSIIFELFNSNMVLATKTIIFRPRDLTYSNCLDFNRCERISNCRKNCYIFGKNNELPVPDDFHFVVDDEDNPYKDIFNKIESLLSLIYISDNVHMQDDKISCQVLGQRMNSYEMKYDEIQYNEVLFDVYSWIYTDGNIVDKVTLARNLLSLHCKHMSLKDMDSKTFMSIKANFSLYQKENVNKYIELKNSLTVFLKDTLNQSKEIVLDIVGQIGKNIVACLSFMLTVFLSDVISGSTSSNIFSKDITYVSYAIIIGSLIYLFLTNIISKYKITELQKGYDIIKRNNDFLTDTKEYEEIFKDEEIENIIANTKKYKRMLLIIWGVIIVLILVLVEFISDYGLCKQIIECVEKVVKKDKMFFEWF